MSKSVPDFLMPPVFKIVPQHSFSAIEIASLYEEKIHMLS